jgi:surface polysaccharide O-acyltransferase-like enzyme
VQSSKLRDYRLDFLRAVAILLVIFIHAASGSGNTSQEKQISSWLTTLARPCIAIFLFLSGYLFNLDSPTRESIVRRFKRVVIPYTVFTVIVFICSHGLDAVSYFVSNIIHVLGLFLLGSIPGPYYFIFLILLIYTIAYIVALIPMLGKHLIAVTLFFLLLGLLQGAYLTLLARHFGLVSLDLADSRIYLLVERSPFYWPFFFFLGVLFRKYEGWEFIHKNKYFIYTGWFITFMAYNLLFFARIDNIDGYNSVIGMLYSITTIGLLLTVDYRSSKVEVLSKMSFYLYLSHIVILHFVDLFQGQLDGGIPSLWIVGVRFIALFTIPFVLYFFLKRILGNKSHMLIGA